MLGSIEPSQCTQVSQCLKGHAQPTTFTLKQGMCLSEACGIHFRRLAVHRVEVTHGDRAGLPFFSQIGFNYKVSSDLTECKMDNNPGPSL